MSKNKDRLYEVEIRSKALLREGKKSLITYFRGGPKKVIASNCKKLYPQYTKPEDLPVVNITPITYKDYLKRSETNEIRQKAHLVDERGALGK